MARSRAKCRLNWLTTGQRPSLLCVWFWCVQSWPRSFRKERAGIEKRKTYPSRRRHQRQKNWSSKNGPTRLLLQGEVIIRVKILEIFDLVFDQNIVKCSFFVINSIYIMIWKYQYKKQAKINTMMKWLKFKSELKNSVKLNGQLFPSA